MILRDRSRILTPLAVFGAGFLIFAWNAAPGLAFHDSGEFALAARTGGIPHPPGAPTWTLFATLWVNLLGFRDNPALGTNLFAAFNGALCLGACAVLAAMWSRRLRPSAPGWHHVAAGVAPALVLLNSSGWLEQSLMTEQYTQMTLLEVAMAILATAMWSASAGARRGWLAWGVGLCAGLAIGNHLSQIALGLPVFLALCFAALRGDAPLRERCGGLLRLNLLAGLGTLCGLLVFLWLPLRSAANPIMDWGNPETLEGFLAAVARKNWERRSLSDAPGGYVGEWLLTYDPLGELGIAGFLLAVAGVAVMAMRARAALALLLAIAVPYAFGMLFAHMGQASLDIQYIRLYGVIDWHIPLYACGALAAGVGVSALLERVGERASRAVAAAVMAMLALGGAVELRNQSLRGWDAPRRYVETVLSGVPQDCYLLLASDNLSHMMAYEHYALPEKPDRFFAYKMTTLGTEVAAARETGEWGWPSLAGYIAREVGDRTRQPLALEAVDPGALVRKPLYTDFNPGKSGGDERYVLPRGFLVEVMEHETTIDEIRVAEAEFDADHPHYYPVHDPERRIHRLEREAWAYLYLKRGGFFRLRGMNDEAVAAYRQSLLWAPEHPETRVALGFLSEERGDTEQAAAFYEEAIVNYRYVQDARVNLAILRAVAGRFDEAVRLLEDELEIRPENELAAANLELVRRDRDARQRQQ